jgi:hypothetical protein
VCGGPATTAARTVGSTFHLVGGCAIILAYVVQPEGLRQEFTENQVNPKRHDDLNRQPDYPKKKEQEAEFGT